MRDVIVKRSVVLVSAVFLLCAGAFAWLVHDEAPAAPPAAQSMEPPPQGAALFERHCAACHALDELGATMKKDSRPRSAFEAFLRDHGEASDAEDRAMVEYLLDGTLTNEVR